MFDPTIYENLKVVLEGAVYDLDLDNEIIVTKREDLVNLADMSRTYKIAFQFEQTDATTVEIVLSSSLNDFAMEKIDNNEQNAGCTIEINFYTKVLNCTMIENELKKIWNNQPKITQTLHSIYGKKEEWNKINLSFHGKINEQYIDDFSTILKLCRESLQFFYVHSFYQ